MNMKKLKLSGKEIRAIGYPEGPVISVAMRVMGMHYKHHSMEAALEILKNVLEAPEEFLQDEILGPVAMKLMPPEEPEWEHISLNTQGIPFAVYGQGQIEPGALQQMYTAAKLPVAVAGALMPDAHAGYGLPIGGVLATNNAVIPYGVGVDIGCRMCLSIYDIDPAALLQKENVFARQLKEATLFGSGAQFTEAADHAVMERSEFRELQLLKTLHGRAWKQLGTSGSGNHFAEFGIVTIDEAYPVLGLEAGTFLGFLSHSGSRGLGANIANHYTRIAKDKRKLNGEAANLAWLDLDEEAGIEYWMAMNLAGDYAAACHEVIHDKIAQQLGRMPLKQVANHHNFAWKEMVDGHELIVHRKGATPAGKDVLGIIPGSMTAPGFIVKGKGEAASVNSAAHGAGRKMSRSVATRSVSPDAMQEELKKCGVKLLGGGTDEAPFAYKDIHTVMRSQHTLVDTIGIFQPKIVRMDG